MTLKIIAITALFATTMLAGANAEVAFDKAKVCAAQKDANMAALTAARAARPDNAAVKALVAAAAKSVPGNNICLADLLNAAGTGTGVAANGAAGDEDIANILGEMADSGEAIETAAGPADETPSFDAPAAPGEENPGQLNTPVTAPAASASTPVLL